MCNTSTFTNLNAYNLELQDKPNRDGKGTLVHSVTRTAEILIAGRGSVTL